MNWCHRIMNTKVAKYFDNIKQNWFLGSTNEYMAVVWRFTVVTTHVWRGLDPHPPYPTKKNVQRCDTNPTLRCSSNRTRSNTKNPKIKKGRMKTRLINSCLHIFYNIIATHLTLNLSSPSWSPTRLVLLCRLLPFFYPRRRWISQFQVYPLPSAFFVSKFCLNFILHPCFVSLPF